MTQENKEFNPVPNSRKLLSFKPLPILLLVLELLFFFKWMPPHVAEEYSIAFAIVGGFLTMALSFWCFFAILPNLFDKSPIFFTFLCMSTLFVFGYLFIVRGSDYSSEELKNHGQKTIAIVYDKSKTYGRRGKSVQSMRVRFITKENKEANAKILLNESEYNVIYEGMRVPIIYSTEHDNIAVIDYQNWRRY